MTVTKRRGKWIVDFRDANGKRHIKTCRTRKEAEDAETELRKKLKDGTFIDPTKLPAFAEVATRWLDARRDYPHSTWNFWRGQIENHLLPTFGPLRVDQIGVAAIEAFKVARLEGETDGVAWQRGDQDGELVWFQVEHVGRQKLARATVNQLLQTLAAVFEYAIDHGYLVSNPAKRVRRARAERRAGTATVVAVDPKEVLTGEQAGQLIEAAPAGLYRTFIKLALYTGGRSGELLALSWDRLDLEAGTTRIDRSLSWERGAERGYGKSKAVFGPTKTPSSVRTLDLVPDLVRDLKAWKLRSAYSQDAELVFSTALGGPLHRAFLHKGLHKALDACPGLPRVDLHGLRHSFASILLGLGKPVTQVAKLLGHANPKITMQTYAHWFEGVSSAGAMGDLAAAMGAATSTARLTPALAGQLAVQDV